MKYLEGKKGEKFIHDYITHVNSDYANRVFTYNNCYEKKTVEVPFHRIHNRNFGIIHRALDEEGNLMGDKLFNRAEARYVNWW
ncbi:hypothetical protein [Sutcliffiella rhizosphaerae]|uniref:Uncharacterized protein n=1 Tax=Sutcliffiella rhizosphaerae TaxID=2880967 RepID=A0ABN8A5I5_9BACI|nr:hypothetical protein [Sutcliffiella rhizosphaerae]CAG9620375.1 hypothetical protein BACCIP111883_01143 [Sutcliffiella rhizosphaerae]